MRHIQVKIGKAAGLQKDNNRVKQEECRKTLSPSGEVKKSI